MKKIKSLLLSALIFVMTCCCFLFTGCDIIDTQKEVYKFSSLKYEKNNFTITEQVGTTVVLSQTKGVILTEDTAVLIIEKDSIAFRTNITYKEASNTVPETYNTYTVSEVYTGKCMAGYDNEFYFVIQDTECIARKDGNTISIVYELLPGFPCTLTLVK